MMDSHLPNDLAGLATAVLWAFSSLAWSLAGRRVGSVAVAAARLLLATAILMAVHGVVFGSPWPVGLAGESVGLLAVSGFLGACVADLCLFRSLVLIGPRQAMLIQSLAPVLAGLLDYVCFGQGLGARSMVGIALTVGGVAWVLAEQKGRQAWPVTPAGFALGLLLSFLSMIFMSGGVVLSHLALRGGRIISAGPALPAVPAFSAGLIRVAAAGVGTWLFLPLAGRLGATLAVFRHRWALPVVLAGTVIGPVIGMWMSMVALAGDSSGVASALINLSPLILIPIVYFAYGEKPSPRTLLGTILAMAGVAMLVMRN